LPKLPGINHQKAVLTLEKADFYIARQGKHMCDDRRSKNSYNS